MEDKAQELEKTFHECFERVESDEGAALREEVAEMRASLDQHSEDIEGVRLEFKQVYEDMDELEIDVRKDIPEEAPRAPEALGLLGVEVQRMRSKIASVGGHVDTLDRSFD